MLTREGARLQVYLELRRCHSLRSGPAELVIVDEQTIERPWGWVFTYTTRGWLNGDSRFAVGGNGPILVNRFDGTFRSLSSALTVEESIADYEAELECLIGAWMLVIEEPSDYSLRVIARVRSVLGLSLKEAVALKRRLPCIHSVGARRNLEPVLARLHAADISPSLQPQPSVAN